MRVEREENGAKLEKVMAFVNAAYAEVNEKWEVSEPGSKKFYEAFGMKLGLGLAKSIFELTEVLPDENVAALVEELISIDLD
ncbi:hypothetical protein [Eisenbergiella sp.]